MFGPDVDSEIGQLSAVIGANPSDLYSRILLGWLYWHRFNVLPENLRQPSLEAAVDVLTLCFLTLDVSDLARLPSQLLPDLADNALSPALSVLENALASSDAHLVAVAVESWQRIVNAIPSEDPDRASMLFNLGNALVARFKLTGALEDLNEAIVNRRQAVDASPADSPDHATILTYLGLDLRERFNHTGSLQDLNDAIATTREAIVSTSTDNPDRGAMLVDFGDDLYVRFNRTGALEDLNDAIDVAQQAVDTISTDDPARAAVLTDLGERLRMRFMRTDVLEDLDRALDMFRAASNTNRTGRLSRGMLLSNLGGALRARFKRTGALANLHNAIDIGRQAVAAMSADDPARATALSNLGVALHERSMRTGDTQDLDNAIGMLRAADEIASSGQSGRGTLLSNLGSALQDRFTRTGSIEDLNDAIDIGQQALEVASDDPMREVLLSNLGSSLVHRFERTGKLADLSNAIRIYGAACDTAPTHGSRRTTTLSNLGAALRARFVQTGALEDLNDAIDVGRQVVHTISRDDPARATALSNLGVALRARFERTDALQDLDDAIEILREAVDRIPPDHPNRATVTHNLGVAMRARFERTDALQDLDDAIQILSEAVDHIHPGKPGRATSMTNLGIVLRKRFVRTGVLHDLNDAIDIEQQAVAATPQDDPARAARSANLGFALRERFDHTGASIDRDAAIAAFESALDIEFAKPSIRIKAARAAAGMAAETERVRAARLLERAVRLLPKIAQRELERADQQYALGDYAGLAADAAALALDNTAIPERARAEVALQLLESGRAVLLSQALHVRSDLTDLHNQYPDLARRFSFLRDQLDTVGSTIPAPPAELAGRLVNINHSAQDHRRQIAAELNDTLANIRAIDGFASFGLPPSRDELLAQAARGPVVTFNISEYRSDALLLTTAGIAGIRLPGLSPERLVQKIVIFQGALHAADHHVDPFERVAAQGVVTEILQWLWNNATGPVLDALGYRQPSPAGATPPRIWWILGGLLSLLPIHAAGYHTEAPSPRRRTVMDRVVSSYTPTITALRYARQHPPTRRPDTALRALIVALSSTPGIEGRLDFVGDEAAALAARLPGSLLLSGPDGSKTTRPIGSLPTKRNVINNLSDYPIAHFACHGTSDPTDPSHSQLLLHDHRSDPLTIACLAPIRLEQAQLAYLSACETALNKNIELIDEVIHLTAAFQLVGYPHVIGTLWPINDPYAAQVAEHFYAALLPARAGDSYEIEYAAHALHFAVRTIRDVIPATPTLWGAYLHAGA